MSVNLIPAVCPKCGGELRVPDDRKVIKCMYCGCEMIMEVKQNPLQPSIDNLLMLADSSAESNPSEAYAFYTKILEVDSTNWKAWFGRVKTLSTLATVENPRVSDVIFGMKKAYDFCPPAEREKMIDEFYRNLLAYVMYYRLTYTMQKMNFDYTFSPKLESMFPIIDLALDIMTSKHTEYIGCIEYGIDICNDMLGEIQNNREWKSLIDRLLEKKSKYFLRIREINPIYQPET